MRFSETVRSFLGSVAGRRSAVLVGILLMLPSLGAGLAADDYYHELMLRPDPGLRGFDHRPLDVFAFAARMWRGAPLMTVLQEMELGYQIEFTGDELADIARFLYDAEAQKDFGQDDVPELIRDWMVDEVYDELDTQQMAQ